MLVEPQQIPDELAATTVPVNPYEQAQIIEQRLMTRANLSALADRIGLYADQPGDDRRTRSSATSASASSSSASSPTSPAMPGIPGATIIGVAFEAPTAEFALKGANELVNLVLQENVRLRTDRAGDTLQFFQAEVERLAGGARAPVRRRSPSSRPPTSRRCPTA